MRLRYPFVTILLLSLASCGTAESAALSEEEASSGDPTYSFNAETTNKDGSVNYEIFVRSFYDHDGDGTGDLLGVKDKLPYLFDMGVKTLWLLPIQNSPSYHGYDVSDYCSVNPDYGTIDDFDALVEEAEKYNIEIMIDMVLNHSSNQHPWFRESYEDYVSNNTDDTSKQDWYNWSETLNEGYSSYNGTYYEARFDSSMPDLNLDCKALRQEIDSIFRFWINDHGVKGFRLDAVKYFYNANIEKNIEFLDFLMDTARQYDSNFYMVGEDWESDAVNLLYYESKCPSFFRFDMSSSIVNTAKGYGKASNFVDEIVVFEPKMHAKNPDAYAGYFLSNHDQDRPTFSTVEDAKLAASLEVLLPGDIWLYYGEEIQLWGKRQNSENSDVRRRLPMIWSKEDKTGECSFPDMSRSDLMGYTQVEDGVYDNLAEPRSLINHYKKLINARNTYNCFKHGNAQSLIEQINDESDSVVAYQLTDGDVSVQIYTNCGTEAKAVTVSGTKILEDIDTMAVKSSLEGTTLTLQPYSTVLMA